MKPPEGFVPRLGSALVRAQLPTHAQLLAAGPAVAEIRTGTQYRDFLGSDGVNGEDLADALFNAFGWSMTARNTEGYLVFARAQEAAAWSRVWPLLSVVRPIVVSLAAANTRFVTAFGSLAQFFEARSSVSRKAYRNRKPKTASDGSTQEQSTSSSASTAASAPASAPAHTPVTSVTVTPVTSLAVTPTQGPVAPVANDNHPVAGGSAPNTHAA
jgi:hypothetical protein